MHSRQQQTTHVEHGCFKVSGCFGLTPRPFASSIPKGRKDVLIATKEDSPGAKVPADVSPKPSLCMAMLLSSRRSQKPLPPCVAPLSCTGAWLSPALRLNTTTPTLPLCRAHPGLCSRPLHSHRSAPFCGPPRIPLRGQQLSSIRGSRHL